MRITSIWLVTSRWWPSKSRRSRSENNNNKGVKKKEKIAKSRNKSNFRKGKRSDKRDRKDNKKEKNRRKKEGKNSKKKNKLSLIAIHTTRKLMRANTLLHTAMILDQKMLKRKFWREKKNNISQFKSSTPEITSNGISNSKEEHKLSSPKKWRRMKTFPRSRRSRKRRKKKR